MKWEINQESGNVFKESRNKIWCENISIKNKSFILYRLERFNWETVVLSFIREEYRWKVYLWNCAVYVLIFIKLCVQSHFSVTILGGTNSIDKFSKLLQFNHFLKIHKKFLLENFYNQQFKIIWKNNS